MSCTSLTEINSADIDNSGNLTCAAAKEYTAKLMQAMGAVSQNKRYKWGDRELNRSDQAEIAGALKFFREQVLISCGTGSGPRFRKVVFNGC